MLAGGTLPAPAMARMVANAARLCRRLDINLRTYSAKKTRSLPDSTYYEDQRFSQCCFVGYRYLPLVCASVAVRSRQEHRIL